MLQEGVTLGPLSAGTKQFTINMGGLYQIVFTATWGGGSAKIEVLSFDQATWVSVSGSFTANAGETDYLAPGTYRVNITTASSVYVSIVRVPVG